ncbi:hypothetical protein GCM10023194_17070 [Planotetraspora phitsanulokensis]|uniref:Uncharacterized protein n=2 Tax=Planotetraspora phitsanulokensis TaxID=575192 RepID=A0A8J3TYI8_9ACTN|nr:hypothetical protein Pph01_00710 [Planotetraspora phitsanulokensis]
MAGLVGAIGAIVVFTLAVYLPSPDQASVGATTLSAPPSPPAGQKTPDEQEREPEEQRFPAGTVIPLPIGREVRDQLSAAARAVVDPSGPAKGAVDVATSGTIYFGVVYGETPETDTRYVFAQLDREYLWSQEGDRPWRYLGDRDGSRCTRTVSSVSFVPRVVARAWGLNLDPPVLDC